MSTASKISAFLLNYLSWPYSYDLCLWVHAEFDALTGCKLSSVDIGAPVLRMAYSPAGGHIIVAVLEVMLLCCLFDACNI